MYNEPAEPSQFGSPVDWIQGTVSHKKKQYTALNQHYLTHHAVIPTSIYDVRR